MPYVELHCHSNFSLLDGASKPEALVARAAELGMPALALTDHDAVYGAVHFIRAAREAGVRPILGAELTLHADDPARGANDPARAFHLTLLAENQAGWHNLCYLISRGRAAAPKGESALPFSELIGCTEGLIALSGCRRGEIAAALLAGASRAEAAAVARRYLNLFGRDHFLIELQRHFVPGDEALSDRLAALAAYLRLECVATNNVHYARPEGHRLQDVLVCIRHGAALDEATGLRRLNSEYYLKPAAEMAALFPDRPEALANTLAVAERCRFELRYGLQDLPHFPTPGGMSSSAYLHRLCREGVPARYGPEPPAAVYEQLAHELGVIERAGLGNYFLIVWDIVRYAREQGIACQGRGSAAGSLVAYLLFISPIDPLAHDLVFERFLSDERQAGGHGIHAPDIDIDFDAARREEVIQYIYTRYGEAHTAMACTFVTFQARSAVRDIGKALALSPEVIAEVADTFDRPADAAGPADVRDREASSTRRLLGELCAEIHDFPRHLGIHSGGMIITGVPLMGRVPTEPATMADRVVVQWDKDALEEVGLVKIDILGLRMLSAVAETVRLIEETTGKAIDLDVLPFTDPAVYEMIAAADTVGVFQVESRAQAQVLPRLRPVCFNDLVISISLIRPGPIQGNMVHPFLRRRAGVEPVTYAHPLLEPALRDTLGVILFQEQVLKVARDLAGFTGGQGEQLRRALGAKRATEELSRFREAFLRGAAGNGVEPEVAERVFEQLLAFGGYSFARSHAAAFAVLVYRSAWLKRYYPAAFFCALLNNQPMGFWTPAVLVNEARRLGMPVFPVDLAASRAGCFPEAGEGGTAGIRLGLRTIKGLGDDAVERLIAERERRPLASLADFCKRTRLGRQLVERLIMAGAMDGWGIPRRDLVWELGTLDYREDTLDLAMPREMVPLPELTPAEAMLAEQQIMGLSPGDHVMTLYRAALTSRGILGSRAVGLCEDGRPVRAAGLLVVHQSPPTAKGFHFLTLEDEDGMINVIIRPKVYERYREVIRGRSLLLVGGDIRRDGHVRNLVAAWVSALE